MLWFDFFFGLFFLNQFKFFKPDRNFQTSLFFFWSSIYKKGKIYISLHPSILFSPILAEFLLIYSTPQLLYTLRQIPIKYEY